MNESHAELIGLGDFGGGDDSLRMRDDAFMSTANFYDPEGINVYDGGTGVDSVTFGPNITTAAILQAVLEAPNAVTIQIAGPKTEYKIRFLNFENFVFSDRTLTMADFGAVSAVPLPAPALMLGAALAGLGGFARRSGGARARRG